MQLFDVAYTLGGVVGQVLGLIGACALFGAVVGAALEGVAILIRKVGHDDTP